MNMRILQKGLSLIELMVAMLVSSIILIAIINLYVGFGSSSRDKEALSTAQDQANFALNELSRQIRMSGAGLCAKPEGDKLFMNPDFNQINANAYSNVPLTQTFTDFGQFRLRSFAAPTAADLNTTLPVELNSDALLLSYSSPLTVRIVDVAGVTPYASRTLAEEMLLSRFHSLSLSSPLETIVEVDSGSEAKNVWLMVSDCDYSELVYYPSLSSAQLSNNILPVPPNVAGRPDGGFKRKYYHSGQVGMVAPVASKLFFVAEGTNGWALYEKDLLADPSTQPVSLMDGVTSMDIDYLFDNGSGTDWQDTATRTSWDEQLPVKITLTMDEGGDANERRSFIRIIDPRN